MTAQAFGINISLQFVLGARHGTTRLNVFPVRFYLALVPLVPIFLFLLFVMVMFTLNHFVSAMFDFLIFMEAHS